MEKTFVMIKPDGVQRNLVGEIMDRFEKKGLKFAAMKMMQVNEETAFQHYAEHKDKPFFEGLLRHITSGPVISMVLEGNEVIAEVRKIVGATNPLDAEPGSIRGDFAVEIGRNLVHASDSPESAEKEIDLFFEKGEIISYEKNIDSWLYE